SPRRGGRPSLLSREREEHGGVQGPGHRSLPRRWPIGHPLGPRLRPPPPRRCIPCNCVTPSLRIWRRIATRSSSATAGRFHSGPRPCSLRPDASSTGLLDPSVLPFPLPSPHGFARLSPPSSPPLAPAGLGSSLPRSARSLA